MDESRNQNRRLVEKEYEVDFLNIPEEKLKVSLVDIRDIRYPHNHPPAAVTAEPPKGPSCRKLRRFSRGTFVASLFFFPHEARAV